MKIAIIVVGYNRIDGLSRLLAALTEADYGSDRPTLILSVDKSDTDQVEKFAREYSWAHGEKIVRTFNENQGLKKHILSCGDYFADFDELVILEDDMYIAPSYYQYAKKCGEYYKDNDNIAGISLYQHLMNIDMSRPFSPIQKGGDVYFMKYAQSWGQVWLKKQWLEFKKWYDSHSEYFTEHEDLPRNVCRWSRKSWLKYHIRYCVESNKYFVYPYVSQATCFADVGVHNKTATSRLQVPMQYGVKRDFLFVPFDRSDKMFVAYDQYFENEALKNTDGYECDVDLYAGRVNYQRRYLLSTAVLQKKVIKSWGIVLRPIEANVLENIEGNEIFLYDLNADEPNKRDNEVAVWNYDYKTDGLIKKQIKIIRKTIIKKALKK